MPRLHLLGTGASLSGPGRTTTMLAADHEGSIVLVDCGGDPIERLISAGLDPRAIDLLILTHAHPDHLCGFPLLMQKLWLAGRGRPLDVLGPHDALDTARRLLDVFDTSGWTGMPTVRWLPADSDADEPGWAGDRWRVRVAPARHGKRPTIAVRLDPASGTGAVAYSADTEYSDAVVALARGAAILVHEATGRFPGHSTASDAARAAAAARVERLILVHLPPQSDTSDMTTARRLFPALEEGEDGSSRDF